MARPAIDMTNQEIGLLTVLYKIDTIPGQTGGSRWMCQCKCGTQKSSEVEICEMVELNLVAVIINK